MFTLRNQVVGIALVLALALVVLAGWSRPGLERGSRCVAVQQPPKKPTVDTKPEQKPGPSIDAADLAIMKALNSRIKISIRGPLIKEVLEGLEVKTEGALNFIIDEQSIRKIDPSLVEQFLNDPVNIVIGQPQKVRTLLKLILGERQMGYYIDDGSIWITTAQVAKSKMVVKNYPVANLVGGQQLIQAATIELKLGSSKQLGPNGQLLSQNVSGLVETIQGTVDPDYWQEKGGPGAMVFIPATASLQIRASREVQYLVMASGLLDNSRQLPAKQNTQAEAVRVFNIAGLINPKNYERSKDELLKALNLIDTKGKSGEKNLMSSMVILAEGQLLVVRQTPEVLFQVAQLLEDMRTMLLPPPPPPAPKLNPPPVQQQRPDPFGNNFDAGGFGPGGGGFVPGTAPANNAVPADTGKKPPTRPKNS